MNYCTSELILLTHSGLVRTFRIATSSRGLDVISISTLVIKPSICSLTSLARRMDLCSFIHVLNVLYTDSSSIIYAHRVLHTYITNSACCEIHTLSTLVLQRTYVFKKKHNHISPVITLHMRMKELMYVKTQTIELFDKTSWFT